MNQRLEPSRTQLAGAARLNAVPPPTALLPIKRDLSPPCQQAVGTAGVPGSWVAGCLSVCPSAVEGQPGAGAARGLCSPSSARPALWLA